ncbi:hypothetical protein GTA08_BOTSDO12684 [Neofusicoccum parvum]|nr:hypothetical protein GTA08_BOTSDO12684 [Neofusicoccum parvum]
MASSAAAPAAREESNDGRARGDSAATSPAGIPSPSNTPRPPNDTDIERAADRKNDTPVTWLSLPNKGQLAVILLARLSEPISERSLTAYVFYQLRWFDPALPAADIAYQMGILTSVFAAAQCVTGVMWGRVADAVWAGRKGALLIGLGGSCIAAVGVGFSRSFAAMLFFRAVCGTLNGNVGVMRAMISETTTEKKYQSRSFLLLPMMFNIGVIIGPMVGGFLAPATKTLDDGSTVVLPSKSGWWDKYPYAPPNLANAFFLLSAVVAVFLGLDETHPSLRSRTDYGRKCGSLISRWTSSIWKSPQHRYAALPTEERIELRDEPAAPTPAPRLSEKPTRPPFRSLLTRNIILVLTQHFLQALHVSTYNTLLYLLLSTPRTPTPLTGGLGLTAHAIGLATATLGLIGLPTQLLLYPRLSTRLPPLALYRLFLPLSAAAYLLLPLLPLAAGAPLWPALVVVLAAQVLSRAFVNPATVILVNNCAPHPAALATLHGLAQSVAAAARTAGPVVGSAMFAWGLERGGGGAGVAVPFWGIAGLAAVNWGILWWVREEV